MVVCLVSLEETTGAKEKEREEDVVSQEQSSGSPVSKRGLRYLRIWK